MTDNDQATVEELQFNKSWLKGLKFHSSKKVKGKEGRMTFQPTERALAEKDILSFAERGNQIVLVTADGQKHQVAK